MPIAKVIHTHAGRAYFSALPFSHGPRGLPDLRRLSELPWSLAGAGRWDEFVRTVADAGFLDGRLRSAGPQAVVDDLDLALDSPGRRALPPTSVEALSTIRAFVRLTSHILGRDPDQFAGQLLGRVDPQGNRILERVLREAQELDPGCPSLRPVGRTLAAPGGDLVATLAGHTDQVHGVGITPDGRLGLSVSADGTLRVWDLDTQAERFILPVGHGPVRSLAVTPDGGQVVSGSEDGSIDVWDVTSGARLRRWQGTGAWRALVFVPDGTRLVSGSNGPGVLWQFETGRRIVGIDPSSHATTAIAVSADARRAVVGGVDDYVALMDLESGRQLAELIQGRDSWVSAVAITPDGRYAFSSDSSGRTKVWDFDTRTQVGALTGHGYNRVTALALIATGEVVSADNVGRLIVHRWSPDVVPVGTNQQEVVLKVVDTRGHKVQQVAVTPDGTRAITAGGDGTVRVWDLTPASDPVEPNTLWESGQVDDETYDRIHRGTWRGVLNCGVVHTSAPPALEVTSSNAVPKITDRWTIVPTVFARRGDEHRGRDSDERIPLAYRVVDHEGRNRSSSIETGRVVIAPRLSLDGTQVCVVTKEGRLAVHDVATGAERYSQTLPPAAAPPRWLAFSPDGRSVLCALADRIVVHQPSTGAAPANLEGPFDWTAYAHDFEVVAPRFTPDGDHVLAVALKQYVALWRVGTPDPMAKWRLPPDAEAGLASDGARAWWFTRDGRLWHWTVGNAGRPGRPVALRLQSPVMRVSVDGRFALALDDLGVRVWRLPAARPVVQRETTDVTSVAVSFAESGSRRRLAGLLALGGTRLAVYDLGSLAAIAAFQSDAAVTRCRFDGAAELSAWTADGRVHHLVLHR
jgi:WD40 repeat protein